MPAMPPRQPARSARRAACGVGLACAALLGGGYIAHADPDSGIPSRAEVDAARSAADGAAGRAAQLDAEYARAAVELAAVQERAAAVAEQANGARWELEQRTRTARETARRAKAATAAATRASEVLREYAAASYQQGGTLESFAPLLNAGGPQELSDRMSALTIVGSLYADRLDEARLAQGTAASLEAAATAAKVAQQQASERAEATAEAARQELRRAESETSRLAGQRAVLAAELARLRRTSEATESRRLDGLAEQARQQAEQARPPAGHTGTGAGTGTSSPTSGSTSTPPSATSTSTSTTRPPTTTHTTPKTPSSSSSTTPTTSSTTPPPSVGGAAAAVAYAQAQLGKPYQWGAAGPDSFDCSGLTMMAWRQAGVYLSHYTGAQWAETARVSIASLQPGDIVFFGYSGESSTHVGLYVGGGQMIEAPHTGAFVRYASIYRSDLVPYGGRPG